MPTVKLKVPTEEQEHLAFMDWVNLNPAIRDVLIHIPNGGSRHPLEAKKLKRMGVKRGVSDFFLPVPRMKYHGLWIELKRKVKAPVLTRWQIEWILQMRENGYVADVARGCEEAINMTKDYFYG